MSESLAQTEWAASWIGLCKEFFYDMRQRDQLNREFKVTAIVSETEEDFNMAVINDAKSLYDNLIREQYSAAEKRAALEICVIKDSLDSLGGTARWIPHELNPVDCMTKLKENAATMLQLLRTGKYRLAPETDEMKNDASFVKTLDDATHV